MKKKLQLLGVAAALGAGYVGIHYRIPIAIALVFTGLAIVCLLTGIRMIVTRQAAIPTSDSYSAHKEYYAGLPAQLWGVIFVIFSLVIGAVALSYWLYGNEPPQDLVRHLFASRWFSTLLIIGAGVTIGMFGLTRLLAGNAAFVETKLRPVERIAGGIYSTVVGALLIVVGLIHALAPGALTAFRDRSLGWVLGLFK